MMETFKMLLDLMTEKDVTLELEADCSGTAISYVSDENLFDFDNEEDLFDKLKKL